MWLVEKLVLDWLDLSYPGGIYNRKKAQVKKIQTHMQYIPFFSFGSEYLHEKAGGLKKKKSREEHTHFLCCLALFRGKSNVVAGDNPISVSQPLASLFCVNAFLRQQWRNTFEHRQRYVGFTGS